MALGGGALAMSFLGGPAFARPAADAPAQAIGLEQVVVSATKTEHTLGDVPLDVEVVTKEEIERRQIKTVQDAMKYLAGVKVNKASGSWGNKGNIEIQGMADDYTLVLVDGQRYLGGHGGGVDIQSLSTGMVERIEIVKGPASSLYGSDAMGGVVNIITKKAGKKPFASFSSSVGSRNTKIAEATGGVTVDKFSCLVGYTWRQTDGVNKELDAFGEHVFNGNFGYAFTPESRLTLRPYYSEQRMDYEKRRQDRAALNADWQWKPDERSTFNLRGSVFNYDHYTEDKKSNWDEDTHEVETTYSRLFFDRHLLTAGYQYYRDEVDDKGKRYDASQYLHSFYLQDEMNFSPFVVVIGARVDHHDLWDTEINPKLSVLYEITKNFKIRGSVGRAFKGPDLLDLYAEGWKMGPYIVHANPALQPEKSIGYQLGMEYGFLKRFLGKISVFRNDIDDMLTYKIKKAGPPPWDMYWINVGEAVVQGAEFILTGALTKTLTVGLGYTRLDTEDKATGKDLARRARDRASITLDQQLPSVGMHVHIAGEYIGERYDDEANNVKLGGYAVCDMAVTKDIGKNLQVFARADNLFGKEDVEDEYDLDGERFLAGIKINF